MRQIVVEMIQIVLKTGKTDLSDHTKSRKYEC